MTTWHEFFALERELTTADWIIFTIAAAILAVNLKLWWKVLR